MGSKSRSTTASTQNTKDITTTVGDNRTTDSGSIGGNTTIGETGGNVSVSTTDFGAIKSAFEGIDTAISDSIDFAETVSVNAQNNSFGLAGASLAANANLSNELLRRDQVVTAAIIDTLGETKSGFDEVQKSINSNAAATGSQLAGLLNAASQVSGNMVLWVAAALGAVLLFRKTV